MSGTNGKTTTTRFLAHAAALAGPVVSNDDGANLPRGLVSVLMDPHIETAARLVAEVDERWLSAVVEATRPEVVVLLNLSRDQLDRMEEVRSTASRWRDGLSVDAASRTTVVANADDPIVVAAVPENAKAVWVGAGLRWRDDAGTCPWCGQRIVWNSDDRWRCVDCGRTRPAVTWQLDGAVLHTPGGVDIDLVLAVPGRHNLSNAAMAVAAAAQLGVDPSDARARAPPSKTSRAGTSTHGGRRIVVASIWRRIRRVGSRLSTCSMPTGVLWFWRSIPTAPTAATPRGSTTSRSSVWPTAA